jgi:Mrp family chromosome partitioning ATPase
LREHWAQGPGLVSSIWRHRWLLAIVGAVGAVGGLGIARQQAPLYEATAVVRLVDPQVAGVLNTHEGPDAEVYTARHAQVVGSKTVADRTAQTLGSDVVASDVRRNIDVTTNPDLLTLSVTARGSTGDRAAELANALVETYQTVVDERNQRRAESALDELGAASADIERRIDAMDERLTALITAGDTDDPATALAFARLDSLTRQLTAVESQMREIEINAEAAGAPVVDVETASVPDAPSRPRPRLLFALGGLVGVGIGSAFSYWRAGRVEGCMAGTDAAEILGAPLLGRLPAGRHVARLWTLDDHDLSPSVLEAYRLVITSIEYELARVDGSSIIVTTPGVARGKTAACLHLALAARTLGRDVLLVDGDLRSEGLSRALVGSGHPGLSDLILRSARLSDVLTRQPLALAGEKIWAVTAGSRTKDAAILRSPSLPGVMRQLSMRPALTIVDCPPLLSVVDTTLLARHVDGVVLLLDESASLSELQGAKQGLTLAAAHLLGYVLVGDRVAGGSAYRFLGRPLTMARRLVRARRNTTSD